MTTDQDHQINDPMPRGSGFGIHDLLFVLFKRKWMILLFALLGFGGAAWLYVKMPTVYQSQAKLLVKYVIAHSDVDAWKSETEAGGRNGNYIINNEMALLTSGDVARSVVEKVGVEHFVGDEETDDGRAGGAGATSGENGKGLRAAREDTGSAPEDSGKGAPGDWRGKDPRIAIAAGRFIGNVEVRAANDTNVIEIRYRDQDPTMVQRVLEVYVDEYFEKHLSIYRPRREDFAVLKDEESALRLQLPGLRASLEAMEEQLRKDSRGDTTENLQQQRGEVQTRLLVAEAELAQQEMVVKMLRDGAADGRPQAGDDTADEAPPSEPIPVPNSRVVRRFQDLLVLERSLQERRIDLRTKFLPGAGALAPVEAQLAELQQERETLVAQHPGLVAATVAREVAAGGRVDLNMEAGRLASIQAGIQIYQKQLDALEGRISGLAEMEAKMAATRRQIEVATKELDNLGERLKVAEREQKIDHRNIPNIDIMEHPSDPVRTTDKKTLKLVLGVAASGLAFGLGLAFLIEVVLDRRIKRPAEIESRLRMPLMLVIPKLGMRSAAPRLEYAGGRWDDGEELPYRSLPPSAGSDRMLGFTEAIRDHLFYYFELKAMRQKPKLIALTGLSKGAGTSTIAAGVATAFGRAGAQVLLVDLHADRQGSGGLLTNGENADHPTSLEIDKEEGMSFNTAGLNVSLITFGQHDGTNGTNGTNGGNGANRASTRNHIAPRRFYEMMPKFRGSDFDFVIFDMPAIESNSSTPAMAGFMDKVVLVLDAENTDREELRRGYADLTRGRAEVSCVFNKTRNHAPRWLER